MNRAKFYDHLRPHLPLTTFAVEGMDALLDAGDGLPLHHMANILAQVRRETGGLMGPIKETVMASHKDKNPTDAEVKRRLDVAFAKGQLSWVKTPYWRDGWFGRGQIQVTHRANYAKFGTSNPDDALKPHISAHIAVKGMTEGLFTGKKLADYAFPAALNNPPETNPRRIVNGKDGSDVEVAGFHRIFAAALQAGGWGAAPVATLPKPTPAKAPWWAFLAALFKPRKG